MLFAKCYLEWQQLVMYYHNHFLEFFLFWHYFEIFFSTGTAKYFIARRKEKLKKINIKRVHTQNSVTHIKLA
jgi:hypothetical protein